MDSDVALEEESDGELAKLVERSGLTSTQKQVYWLFRKKQDLASVAAERGVKASTICNYLAEAVK